MTATTAQPIRASSPLRGSRGSSPLRSSELAAKRNPFLSDPELTALLGELRTIAITATSTPRFEQWQVNFLERLESILDQKGMDEASRVNQSVVAAMARFQKTLDRVLACGRLEASSPLGVKAQNAMNRLKEGCLDVEQRLRGLIMDNSPYDKFQMAAVLVRDRFRVFGILQSHADKLETLQDNIHPDAVDKQILAAMTAYRHRMASFGDITAYLGLEEVMLKTLEFETLAATLPAQEEEDATTDTDAMTNSIPEVSKHSSKHGSDSEEELEDASISETEAETMCSEDNSSQSDFQHSSSFQEHNDEDLSPEERAELAELERLIALEEAKILEEERLTRRYEDELERLEAEEREAEARRRARIRAMKEKVAAMKLQIQQILDRKEQRQKQQQQQSKDRPKRNTLVDWGSKPAWREQQERELAAAQKQREEQRLQKQEAARALAEKQRKGRMAAIRESRKAKMAALRKEEQEMRSGVRASVSTSARDLMVRVRAQNHDDLEEQDRPAKKGLPGKSKSAPSDDARAAIAKARALKAKRKSRRASAMPSSA